MKCTIANQIRQDRSQKLLRDRVNDPYDEMRDEEGVNLPSKVPNQGPAQIPNLTQGLFET